jgi:hypothetical protein
LQVTHRVDDNRVDLKTLQQYPQFGPDDGHKRMRDAYRFMVRFDTLATAQNLSLDKRIRTLQLLFYNEADRRWFERTMETVRASTPNLTWDDVRKLFEEHFGLKGQRDLFRNLLLTPAAHQRDNEGITSYYDRFIELASRAGESVEADNGLIVNHFRRGLTPFLRESLERMEATADYIANSQGNGLSPVLGNGNGNNLDGDGRRRVSVHQLHAMLQPIESRMVISRMNDVDG